MDNSIMNAAKLSGSNFNIEGAERSTRHIIFPGIRQPVIHVK